MAKQARNSVDVALEDSFPASDPPASNMGRERTPVAQAASRPKQKKQPRRTSGSTAKSRVERADVREDVRAGERQLEGRAMPRGRLMLSPLAWMRWLLRRTVRPAERQF
ncbi:hypothetical protein [Nevskia soli]|uniref:hypothetical protein n=1 Tax=Nevskia soli TaxID=418856 RepID=UPI0004A70762|nr:hypothetical protein [Nevskia soli]